MSRSSLAPRRAALALVALLGLAVAAPARADDAPVAAASAPASAPPAPPPPPPLPFSDAQILDAPRPYFHVESVRLMYTHFDQSGNGYQSRAGPPGGPGSEQATIEQPQLEVVAKQGAHLTHRIWVPIDVVTAASPDAIDVVSTASRTNEAGSFDWTSTYEKGKAAASLRNGLHEEENYRSWNVGLGGAWSIAEDNAVVTASLNEVYDWFDKYKLHGAHDGHTARSSTNLNAGLTQLLSPTTVAHLDYGLTLQSGQLGNGWNIVPTPDLGFIFEVLPDTRQRHAFVARIAQALPWAGALHAFYRFYADDWGIRAHTVEFELHQRLSSFSRLRLTYRYHHQIGADFFTTRAVDATPLRTADSDLATLSAHTIGVKGSFDFPAPFARLLHADLAVERYFRSNDLRASVISCGLGLFF